MRFSVYGLIVTFNIIYLLAHVVYVLTYMLGPVLERPISANAGLKFCSTFCIAIARLFDGELALQSVIKKTRKLSPKTLSFKLLYCIYFFLVIVRLLYISVKRDSLSLLVLALRFYGHTAEFTV